MEEKRTSGGTEMIAPQDLLGVSVRDERFLEFWGDKDPTGETLEVEGECLLSQPARGLSIVLDPDLQVSTVSLFLGGQSETDHNYRSYQGTMPEGLRFGMRRHEVESQMGEPIEQNLTYEIFMGVEIRPWNKYRRNKYLLTVEFDKSGSQVVAVSVTSAE